MSEQLQCPECGSTNVERGAPIYASQSGVDHNAPFVIGHEPHVCRDCYPLDSEVGSDT